MTYRPFSDHDRAAAALIAAAPAMLEALAETLEYWETTGFSDCEPGCDCIVDKVRAALASAHNRAPIFGRAT
jgi:hypothetical protein